MDWMIIKINQQCAIGKVNLTQVTTLTKKQKGKEAAECPLGIEGAFVRSLAQQG